MTDEPDLCPHCGQPMPPLKPWANEDDARREHAAASEAEKRRRMQLEREQTESDARRMEQRLAERRAHVESLLGADETDPATD